MLQKIFKEYDKLQLKYGDSSLNAVYGGGCVDKPQLCLVFVNPTARNITSQQSWQGPRYPWLTTKQVWSYLTKCGLFDSDLNDVIQSKSSKDWDERFCERVYKEVADKKIYITNLAKCTQLDARELGDDVFRQYLDLLKQELNIINPDKVVLFGNQVSSIVLNTKISVSQCRKQKFELALVDKVCPAYAVYYPVGNGRFNIDKAIEDLTYISKV